MSTDGLIIAISIAVVAFAFVILVIFLACTLFSLRKTIVDLNDKMHTFDPLFRVVSKTGDVIERRTNKVRQRTEEVERAMEQEQQYKRDRVLNTALEVAEWTLVGVALWQKIRERK